jgi:hypothetical protein
VSGAISASPSSAPSACLDHEGFLVAAQPRQINQGRHLALRCLWWQENRETHGQSDFARIVLVKTLRAAKAGVFADESGRRAHDAA